MRNRAETEGQERDGEGEEGEEEREGKQEKASNL